MKTQFDAKERVVSLENLNAMCERISGFCHRFEVVKVSRSRVHIAYSNPDEYGNESPMTAVFPCYPSTFDGHDNPAVVLDYLRIINDDHDGEGWQCFEELRSCPILWRDPETGAWMSEDEIRARKANA